MKSSPLSNDATCSACGKTDMVIGILYGNLILHDGRQVLKAGAFV